MNNKKHIWSVLPISLLATEALAQSAATISWSLVAAPVDAAPVAVPIYTEVGLAVLSLTLLLAGLRMLKRRSSNVLSVLMLVSGLSGLAYYSPSLVQTAQAIIPVVELDTSPKELNSGENTVMNVQSGPIKIDALTDGACAIDQELATDACQVGTELAAGETCGVYVSCATPNTFVAGNTAVVVSAEGIDGTGTIEFRCLEWEGSVCVRPQSRVPSATCASYDDADVWHDMTYFNSPAQRICPSTCAAVTTSGTVVSCAAGSETATATANGHVSTGYAAADTGCLGANDVRWRNDYTGQTGNLNIRQSSYGSGQPRLRLECDWD